MKEGGINERSKQISNETEVSQLTTGTHTLRNDRFYRRGVPIYKSRKIRQVQQGGCR